MVHLTHAFCVSQTRSMIAEAAGVFVCEFYARCTAGIPTTIRGLSTRHLRIQFCEEKSELATTADTSSTGTPARKLEFGPARILCEAVVDLLTLCTGPPDLTLNLLDDRGTRVGAVAFHWSMKLVLPDYPITFTDLELRLHDGIAISHSVHVSSSQFDCDPCVIHLTNRQCKGPYTLMHAAVSLADMLYPVDDAAPSELLLLLMDGNDMSHGVARLQYRSVYKFSVDPCDFAVPVRSRDGLVIGEICGRVAFPDSPRICQECNDTMSPSGDTGLLSDTESERVWYSTQSQECVNDVPRPQSASPTPIPRNGPTHATHHPNEQTATPDPRVEVQGDYKPPRKRRRRGKRPS